MDDFLQRLKDEAADLALKLTALNSFMSTQRFVDLDRANKDLLYSQQRSMSKYLQILGQRLELLGSSFEFKK
tara:strand:+ start:130 stop:345 length:216 start_codon:yes stop_codon:yes gene_type:complete